MSDRLSLVDASLLTAETPATPMNVGGVAIFEPGLDYHTVLKTLEARLDRVPLGRSRVQQPAPGAGRPVWVDDTDFDLSYHLRHSALPAPGDTGQLGQFLSRLIARPLDRSRPLWEIYVIDGLEGGRVALFRKAHVALTGEGGGDPFGVLLDVSADSPPPVAGVRWEPRPEPGQLELAVDATRERVGRLWRVGRGLRSLTTRAVTRPGEALGVVATAAGSAANVVLRLAQQAPSSPLNGTLSPHRRYTMVGLDLEDFRTVRRNLGSTVNDVVVAVTADAVGRLLRWRGHETKDLDLRVMVPVRVHDSPGAAATVEAEVVAGGVVGVLAPLPVMQMDPVARLYRIMGEMAGLKESRQAMAADNLVRLAGYGPSSLHGMAARVASAEQRYNVALSNAPGPQEARYLAGARLEASYPFIPLTGTAGLSVSVSSYAGRVYVGLLGDRDIVPDLDLLGEFFVESLSDLVSATGTPSA